MRITHTLPRSKHLIRTRQPTQNRRRGRQASSGSRSTARPTTRRPRDLRKKARADPRSKAPHTDRTPTRSFRRPRARSNPPTRFCIGCARSPYSSSDTNRYAIDRARCRAEFSQLQAGDEIARTPRLTTRSFSTGPCPRSEIVGAARACPGQHERQRRQRECGDYGFSVEVVTTQAAIAAAAPTRRLRALRHLLERRVSRQR